MHPIQTSAIFFAKNVVFILLAVSLLWFFLKVPKSLRKDVVLIGAISLPLAFLFSLIAAKLYYDPRPFVVGHFNPLVAHGQDNGFPSDHTLLAATVSAVVFRFDRRIGTVLFLSTMLIGISRMYVGVHHFIDILGATIIAVLSVYVAHLVSRHFLRPAQA